MDWVGPKLPDEDAIAGRRVLRQGAAHVKTVGEARGRILGCRPLSLDQLEPGSFLDQSPGGGCRLMKGFEIVGPASAEEQARLPVFPTWGYAVIPRIAETLLGGSAP